MISVYQSLNYKEKKVVGGRDVNISCFSNSNPTWYVEGLELQGNVYFSKENDIHYLHISNFNKKNVGMYVCRAEGDKKFVYYNHKTNIILRGKNATCIFSSAENIKTLLTLYIR